MWVVHWCGLVLAMVVAVLATPAPLRQGKQLQYFYLRANCPNEPWHGRHLVALPSSHQLGLENFTVHPTTPPLKFRPVKLSSGNYALQGEDSNNNDSEAPYLVALNSKQGTRTASMAIVHMRQPTPHFFKAHVDSCPQGYDCVVDHWTFDAAMDMTYPNFRFAGYKGNWAPFKDAGKEGWHVYWKGNAGLSHPIQLDLVVT